MITFNIAKTSNILLWYLIVIYTLLFITIHIYLKVTTIKLIILTAAYLNLLTNIAKHISKTARGSILQLHYHHPRDWRATYADGEVENIVITNFFVSGLAIILTINNLAKRKEYNEIIVKDQMSNHDFNQLHAAVHFITYTKPKPLHQNL